MLVGELILLNLQLGYGRSRSSLVKDMTKVTQLRSRSSEQDSFRSAG